MRNTGCQNFELFRPHKAVVFFLETDGRLWPVTGKNDCFIG